jgi:hypothetical protein
VNLNYPTALVKAVVLSLLLAGCASHQPDPITVKVPVSIPCVQLPLPERPKPTAMQFGAGQLGRTFPGYREAIKAAEHDWSMWELYANDLEAAYAGCRAIQPEQKAR